METLRVTSWGQLSSLLLNQEKDNTVVFRGHANSDWDIKSSLSRTASGTGSKAEKHIKESELPILRSFIRYAHTANPEGGLFGWLALMQHHACPTRLVDFTRSPFVALHFLTVDDSMSDVDGCVWMIDSSQVASSAPYSIRTSLDKKQGDLFSIKQIEDAVKTATNNTDGPVLLSDITTLQDRHGEFLLFFEPPSLDSRIMNQVGVFALPSDPSKPLNDSLSFMTGVTKIIVPAALKKEIRQKLDQININERSMFPGLDGLASFLTRQNTQKMEPAAATPTVSPVLKPQSTPDYQASSSDWVSAETAATLMAEREIAVTERDAALKELLELKAKISKIIV
eukprot:TRINITY_DN25138_c0_g1_i1.p1 TRINITY_DN25138_c0_g1~~TRINITY_DN25138_c0_g1_i1.p1  ORF type:complete len:340 (+),score=60.60 TRINITY_DN25138_c0_g1_i1:173-1192(+)